MRRKNLKQKITLYGLIVAFLVIVALGVIIFLGYKRLQETKEHGEALQAEIDANKQLVYVSSRAISKGETVDDTNLMQQMIYTGLPADYYITDEDLGGTLITDIQPNAPIMKGMVKPIEITQDMREYEVLVAHLMTTQKEDDVVDVRILFPNGEDYLLLSKKPVHDLSMSASLFTTYLNEEEILRMGSAIVDAYTSYWGPADKAGSGDEGDGYSGYARIYTVRYVEENIQDEALPYYPVKAETLDLINSDPNILTKAENTLHLQARMDLEVRMQDATNKGGILDGFNNMDSAADAAIQDRLQTEADEATDEESGEPEEAVSENEVPEGQTEAAPVYDYGQGTGTDGSGQGTGTDNSGIVIELTQ